MWIFQFKFSSIFIARYIKYFVCLLFISNIFLKYWFIHLSYWNEKQSIYIRNRYSQRKYQKKLFSKGSSTCTYVQRWREGRGQAKCIQLHTMGEGGSSRLGMHTQKNFGLQNLKTFLFLYKRNYYIAIYYCV